MSDAERMTLGIPANCSGGPLDGAEAHLPTSVDTRCSGAVLMMCVDGVWQLYKFEAREVSSATIARGEPPVLQVLQYRGEVDQMPTLKEAR